jgi:hypothetical protein
VSALSGPVVLLEGDSSAHLGRVLLLEDDSPAPLGPVIPTTEVIPSRGVRALEGEGRGLSHLEVIARGRLWRQLAGRGIDRGAQRVTTDLFVSILLFL